MIAVVLINGSVACQHVLFLLWLGDFIVPVDVAERLAAEAVMCSDVLVLVPATSVGLRVSWVARINY